MWFLLSFRVAFVFFFFFKQKTPYEMRISDGSSDVCSSDLNAARFINHSCAPNCEAVVHQNKNGKRHKDKIQIEAIRDIAAGEELTYNYGIVLHEPHTARLKKLWACHCGAPNCTGTLLQPKRRK